MKIDTKKHVVTSLVLATVITVTLLIVTKLFTDSPINWFETTAVFFSFASTWLCTKQVRLNYVLAIFGTALLSITFWQAGLFGSMALNIYLIPTVIIGWFMWGKDSNPKPVEHVKLNRIFLYLFFTALTWVGALFTIKAFGGNLAMLDGWLLVGTVLAQFLLDRKKIETWIVWSAVNVVSVYVYFESGLYLLAAQFLLFLANAIYGWFQWRKTMISSENLDEVSMVPVPAIVVSS